MKPDPERKFKTSQWPSNLYNDWNPSNNDMNIVRQRIEERIKTKPEWYRKTTYSEEA